MEAWLQGLIAFLVFIVVILLPSSIKILREYERAVKFRLGRFVGLKGPGLFFIIPGIDRLKKVDLRVVTLDVPKQRIVTKDNVSVDVDAIVYTRVFDPKKAILNVENYLLATSFLGQTTLRDILGKVELDALLTKREDLSKRIQTVLDEGTDPWGMKISAVTIRDVSIPAEMLRAIAKQAEAERERRSRVIMAQGESEAAAKMAEAAKQYQKNPAGMRLRELQMLIEVAREKNLIVVTPAERGTELGEVAGLVSALKAKKKE